jgi:2-phospho-L-lactate guanylyltransferase (CobY/MobA/RfbA family)
MSGIVLLHGAVRHPVPPKRQGDPQLALAMLRDVEAAVTALGHQPLVVEQPGGQGQALAAALAALDGPVTILNADLPAATSAEIELLERAAPAVVAAGDGTTNAVALADASDFAPVYGPGSEARFVRLLGAARLELPGLRDDVDTWEDLQRVRERVGEHTRRYLERRKSA